MRIFKSLLAGVVLAFLAAVLGTLIELSFVVWKLSSQLSAESSGGLGAVSVALSFPYYALIGFGAGAFWYYRRSGRTRLAPATPPSL